LMIRPRCRYARLLLTSRHSPPIASLSLHDALPISNDTRFKSNISELDRTLGGGFVTGSLILIGGDPGIGKSTLTLQIAESNNNLDRKSTRLNSSHVSISYAVFCLKKKN